MMARPVKRPLQMELRKFYTELLEWIVNENSVEVSVAMLEEKYPLKMTGKTHPYAYIDTSSNNKPLVDYFPTFLVSAWHKAFFQIDEGCFLEYGDDLEAEIDVSGEMLLEISQQIGTNMYIQGGGGVSQAYEPTMVWKIVWIPQYGKHYICVINLEGGSQYWTNIYPFRHRSENAECINLQTVPLSADIQTFKSKYGGDWKSYFYVPIFSSARPSFFINWVSNPLEVK